MYTVSLCKYPSLPPFPPPLFSLPPSLPPSPPPSLPPRYSKGCKRTAEDTEVESPYVEVRSNSYTTQSIELGFSQSVLPLTKEQ